LAYPSPSNKGTLLTQNGMRKESRSLFPRRSSALLLIIPHSASRLGETSGGIGYPVSILSSPSTSRGQIQCAQPDQRRPDRDGFVLKGMPLLSDSHFSLIFRWLKWSAFQGPPRWQSPVFWRSSATRSLPWLKTLSAQTVSRPRHTPNDLTAHRVLQPSLRMAQTSPLTATTSPTAFM
jgi:hypothetical protein